MKHIIKKTALVFVISFMLVLVLSQHAWALDINLIIEHKSINERVEVTVINKSSGQVKVKSIYIELFSKKYENRLDALVGPGKNINTVFTVSFPALPGSYPIKVAATYLNEGQTLSIVNVGLFYYQRKAALKEACIARHAYISDAGDITIKSQHPDIWRLVLPDELFVLSSIASRDESVFNVRNTVTGFNNNYQYFAVAEQDIGGTHHTAICKGTIATKASTPLKAPVGRGRLSSKLLLAQIALFLVLCSYILFFRNNQTRLSSALGKYASRMLLLTASYYFLKNIPLWLETSLHFIRWDTYAYFARIVINNFLGSNYTYFFKYFIDIYWALSLVLSFAYLYYFDSERELNADKYSSFVKTLISILNIPMRRRVHWDRYSKLGMLTFFVKIFYIPLLTTWVINNTIHQRNLTASFAVDLQTINAYLVALFIYVDTMVFSFGYIVEARFLKNEIKSVEPTVLGWLVTLWCYPPFNAFSFRIFDYPLFNIYQAYPQWVNVLMTCTITVLWGVFAWASVTLGAKASNLTNRGIVRHGPYRFVRHPAYSAKLFIWIIQGVFFAQFTVGILIAFTFIYLMRAWTEERHLKMDPDYHEYRAQVKWWFIPRLM